MDSPSCLLFFALSLPGVQAAPESPSPARTPQQESSCAPRFSSSFGESVCVVPSILPGGTPRIAVSDDEDDSHGPLALGRVYVFSDGWGNRPIVLESGESGSMFGTCMAASGDRLVVGSSTLPVAKGHASLHVYRASNLERQYRIELETAAAANRVWFAPDLDGDGTEDLVVKAVTSNPTAKARTRMLVVSSGTRKVLRELDDGLLSIGSLGALLPRSSETSNGPWHDTGIVTIVLEGTSYESRVSSHDGVVRKTSLAGLVAEPGLLDVRSFPTKNPAATTLLTTNRVGSELRLRWIALPDDPKARTDVLQELVVPNPCEDPVEVHLAPDLNADGEREFLVSRSANRPDFDALVLSAMDGANGKQLWRWSNDLLEATVGTVQPAWDADADGVVDILVGVVACPHGPRRGTNVVVMLSGATGKVLASLHEP